MAASAWDAIKTTTPVLMPGGMVAWRGLFTSNELDALERQCDALALEPARLTGDSVNSIPRPKTFICAWKRWCCG